MVWTNITRGRYERIGGRYASDCSDVEWSLIEPFMPARKVTGRPRSTRLRDVWDAFQYMASTGCQSSMIPNDFPPPSTVQRYFYAWRDSGLLHRINHAPVMVTWGNGGTGTGRARSFTNGGSYRQPVGQNHREWRDFRI